MKSFQTQKWFSSRFVFGTKLFSYKELHEELGPAFVPSITQVHGVAGLVIDEKARSFPKQETFPADFLLTNELGVLLPILTADCLPIFLCDPLLGVIGAVHAGWRGSVAGVLDNAIVSMTETFKTDIKNLQLLFGPCARACCYEIKADCIDTIKSIDSSDLVEQALVVRASSFYFDLVMYNFLRACKNGVLPENIDFNFSSCTLCTDHFFSSRKHGKGVTRNINGIILV